ncbi:MAG: urease accessory protein UreD [Pseudomonadota bacterium]
MPSGRLSYQRAVGRIRLGLGDRDGQPQLRTAFQDGCAKLRFPARSDGLDEAMVLNTAGGLADGDRFEVSVSLACHRLITSTQASERVYRSEGGTAKVVQQFSVSDGAHLIHMPQPTILYDRAALRRRSTISLTKDAGFTFCEGLVLGRAAMGERVTSLDLHDRTEVIVDGEPHFIDALRLDDEALLHLDREAMGSGALAIGLVIHRGERLGGQLDVARDAVGSLGGATIVGGCLVARLLAPSHRRLQDALLGVMGALSGVAPPRAWQL